MIEKLARRYKRLEAPAKNPDDVPGDYMEMIFISMKVRIDLMNSRENCTIQWWILRNS